MRRRFAWWGTFGFVGIVAACTRTEPAPGALLLAVQTDMHAPKDVDAVGVYVARTEDTGQEQIIFGFAQKVAPNGTVNFPATLAVVGTQHPGVVVHVRAVAFQGSKAHVVRDAITTIPTSRTALLRLPLRWINWNGQATGAYVETGGSGPTTTANLEPLSNDDPANGFLHIGSGCTPDMTPVNGVCAPARIDENDLPDYDEQALLGPPCFNAESCFKSSTKLAVDVADCSAPAPSGDFQIALATPPGHRGDCDGDACYIPLDKAPDADPREGWAMGADGRVHVAKAYCDHITQGDVLGLVVTTGCPARTDLTTLCGGGAGSGDGGITGDDGGGTDGSGDDGGDGSTSGAIEVAHGLDTPTEMVADGQNLYVAARGGAVYAIPKTNEGVAVGAPLIAGTATDAGPLDPTSFQLALGGGKLLLAQTSSTSIRVFDTAGVPGITLTTARPVLDVAASAAAVAYWLDVDPVKGFVIANSCSTTACTGPTTEGSVQALSGHIAFGDASGKAYTTTAPTKGGTLLSESSGTGALVALDSLAATHTPGPITFVGSAPVWATAEAAGELRAPVAGTLVSNQDLTRAGLASDGKGDVFWSAGSAIRAYNGNGSSHAVTTLFNGANGAGAVVADGSFVYWVETQTGLVRKVSRPTPIP